MGLTESLRLSSERENYSFSYWFKKERSGTNVRKQQAHTICNKETEASTLYGGSVVRNSPAPVPYS
jgi:hypothetical protein